MPPKRERRTERLRRRGGRHVLRSRKAGVAKRGSALPCHSPRTGSTNGCGGAEAAGPDGSRPNESACRSIEKTCHRAFPLREVRHARQLDPGCPLRRTLPPQEPRFHHHRPPDHRTGHRRQHGHVQRGVRGAAAAVALPAPAPSRGAGVRIQGRAGRACGDLPPVPVPPGEHTRIPGPDGHDAGGVQPVRGRPRGPGQRAAGVAGLFRRAGGEPGAGAGVRGGRGPAGRRTGRDPLSRAVGAALRLGPRRRGALGAAGRVALHRGGVFRWRRTSSRKTSAAWRTGCVSRRRKRSCTR